MNCNVDQNDTKVSMSLEIVLHPSLQAQSSLIMNSAESLEIVLHPSLQAQSSLILNSAEWEIFQGEAIQK